MERGPWQAGTGQAGAASGSLAGFLFGPSPKDWWGAGSAERGRRPGRAAPDGRGCGALQQGPPASLGLPLAIRHLRIFFPGFRRGSADTWTATSGSFPPCKVATDPARRPVAVCSAKAAPLGFRRPGAPACLRGLGSSQPGRRVRLGKGEAEGRRLSFLPRVCPRGRPLPACLGAATAAARTTAAAGPGGEELRRPRALCTRQPRRQRPAPSAERDKRDACCSADVSGAGSGPSGRGGDAAAAERRAPGSVAPHPVTAELSRCRYSWLAPRGSPSLAIRSGVPAASERSRRPDPRRAGKSPVAA